MGDWRYLSAGKQNNAIFILLVSAEGIEYWHRGIGRICIVLLPPLMLAA